MKETHQKPSTNIDYFATFAAFSKLRTFEGQDPTLLLKLYIEKRKAYQDGYGKAVKDIGQSLRKQFDLYMSINTRITGFVKDQVEKEWKNTDLKLIEARADLSLFVTGEIKILFIIDSTIDAELWFSSIVNDLVMKIFEDDNVIPDILFLNQRGKEIDKPVIDSAYPSIRLFDDAQR